MVQINSYRNKNDSLFALGVLASSIVGREIPIKYLSRSSQLAYSDSSAIFIKPNTTIEYQRLEVLSQAVLLKLGTLQEPCVNKLIGKSNVKNRFILVELARGHRLFFNQLPRLFLSAFRPFISDSQSQSAEDSLYIAQSFRQIPQGPEWVGSIRPFKLFLGSRTPLGKAINSDELSDLENKTKAPDNDKDDDENSYKDKLWEYLSSPLGNDGMFSKALRDLLDMSSSPDGTGQEGSANTTTEQVKSKKVKFLQDMLGAIRSRISIGSDNNYNENAFGTFPEWNYKKKDYVHDWVTAEEVEPYTPDCLLDDLTLEHRHFYSFHKALSHLQFGIRKCRGEPYGDNFDLDRLVQFKLDARAGQCDEALIYTAMRRESRDLSVEILVDVSSSTLELAEDDKPIAHHHINLAWLLCRSFTLLGDRVALHGFHSWGRKLLKLQRIKAFGESSLAKIDRRLKNLSVAGYTRIGAAIRFGAKQLDENKSTAKKLLFVVSDGYPYDDQYEGKYALQDTKKALEEARSKGLACLCLAVGSDVNEARLKEVYGDTNFLLVDRIEKIPGKLPKMIADAFRQIN